MIKDVHDRHKQERLKDEQSTGRTSMQDMLQDKQDRLQDEQDKVKDKQEKPQDKQERL